MSKVTVLVVEDDGALREVLSETLQLANFEVHTAQDGKEALQILSRHQNIALVVSDVQMKPMDGNGLMLAMKTEFPSIPIILMTAYGTVERAVNAMRFGASDYLVKPFESASLIAMVSRFTSQSGTKENLKNLTDSEKASQPTGTNKTRKKSKPFLSSGKQNDNDLIAVDSRSQEMVQVARRVAATDVTVMLTGESGVGKEVVSQFIHQHSLRANGPFVAINCAAIPENMLESVLFGYEKGAFTGAHQAMAGKFEQAQGGTLLLDEVTEMDLGLQAKLLRVLQEREVERLGGRNPIALDVRIIATTNRDFHQVVADGDFREDLFYRLNVFPLTILPLRERVLDVLPLAQRLIERYSSRGINLDQNFNHSGTNSPITLSVAAKDVLVAHPWPGNVRELDNVIQRALILKQGTTIEQKDIHFEQSANAAVMIKNVEKVTVNTRDNIFEDAPQASENALSSDLMSHEKDLIMSAIASRGSRKAAAEKLGISPRTLRYKLARLRDAGVAIPA